MGDDKKYSIYHKDEEEISCIRRPEELRFSDPDKMYRLMVRDGTLEGTHRVGDPLEIFHYADGEDDQAF